MKTYRLAGVVVTEDDRLLCELDGTDCISAKRISEMLADADGEDITFNLNSEGGSVFAGTEIYSMLNQYTGKVVVNINGLSASIASVLMLGADVINMSLSGQIMIHRVSGRAIGNADDLNKALNAFTSSEKTLVNLYHKKTGLPKNKLAEMMSKETWLTAEEALELGFVDSIIGESDYSQTADTSLVAQYKERVSNAKNFSLAMTELKNQLKEEKMDDKTSLLEKIKNILGSDKLDDTIKNEAETVEPTEEVVAEPEDTEEPVEETPVEDAETPKEEVAEESTEEETNATDELVEALEKATNKIEEIQAENADLKAKLEAVTKERDDKTKVANKAESIVNRLNNLLKDTETDKVVMSNQKSEKEASRGRFNFGGK